MALVVREARPTEYEAVGQVTVEAYVSSGHILATDFYAAHLQDAGARARDAELLVAELDGTVVGTVTFCPQGSPYAEVAGPGEGEFRMLAVAPAGRRQGVADALVRACLDRSRALGYGAVVLSTMPVQVEAQRLYERLGFRRTPEKDWSPAPGVQLIGFRLDL